MDGVLNVFFLKKQEGLAPLLALLLKLKKTQQG
jgi:hypothetical protein